jgi:cell division protein FtsB
MPTAKIKEPVLQLTISLAEVVQLQTENAALKKQVGELQAQNKLLEKQLHDLTDPVKKASAAAFKNRRGL